ncbi:MAG: 4,5-DOPA dioxygenase extradiol [Bacteroidetes bacterium]|nr:4,5-DOPA dioxygenase extradiol [Bacteroidota bacterium]
MDRRTFIKNTLAVPLTMQTLKDFKQTTDQLNPTDELMPALFVGHGNPMNAIEDNEFSRGWAGIGKSLPKPKAILCVSAHWQTSGTMVTAMPKPPTIHDFGGFPEKLFQTQYPAPGAPELAKEITTTITKTKVELDYEWGLDHGCWSVLLPMFPKADIPTFQLSLDYTKPPQYHFELVNELKAMRKKGVLILGSGNIVHNLGLFEFTDKAFDWAVEFDEKIKSFIEKGDYQSVVDYQKLGKIAQLAVPTNEHYLPLLYSLALRDKGESVKFFNARTTAGSISMRSLKIG